MNHDQEPQSSRQENVPSGRKPERRWPHAPVHKLALSGTYFVTASTYRRLALFNSRTKLDGLESGLLALAEEHGWALEAWAVFPNHYHFIAHSPPDAGSLSTFLGHLHTSTAERLNEGDAQPGRKVWHNFWETRLTYEKSCLARLNYVHQNPVKHGLVRVANQWKWCSAAWFERTATPAQVRTIYSFRTDRMNVFDPFEVPPLLDDVGGIS